MSIIQYFTKRFSGARPKDSELMVIKKILNFATKNVSAADVVEALSIKAKTFVHKVGMRVITAEGGTCTATIGDGAAADGWDASVNLNASAGTMTSSVEGTDTNGAGKFYNTADTIDLTMGHDTDAAKVEVWALISMHDNDG